MDNLYKKVSLGANLATMMAILVSALAIYSSSRSNQLTHLRQAMYQSLSAKRETTIELYSKADFLCDRAMVWLKDELDNAVAATYLYSDEGSMRSHRSKRIDQFKVYDKLAIMIPHYRPKQCVPYPSLQLMHLTIVEGNRKEGVDFIANELEASVIEFTDPVPPLDYSGPGLSTPSHLDPDERTRAMEEHKKKSKI